ncbi:MAG: hypothetical protein KIT40_16575 [Nitrospira sp.]|nr:hypothetical protein [Nitrospira sp.]
MGELIEVVTHLAFGGVLFCCLIYALRLAYFLSTNELVCGDKDHRRSLLDEMEL